MNPNGTKDGITAFTAANGRVTIMMPHPKEYFVNRNCHGSRLT